MITLRENEITFLITGMAGKRWDELNYAERIVFHALSKAGYLTLTGEKVTTP